MQAILDCDPKNEGMPLVRHSGPLLVADLSISPLRNSLLRQVRVGAGSSHCSLCIVVFADFALTSRCSFTNKGCEMAKYADTP